MRTIRTIAVRPTASRRLIAVLAACLLTMFAFAGLTATPAAAHDELVSANPEDGAELDEQPAWIELEFSGEVQELGSEVAVMHNGTDVSAGELAVDGTKLTVALPDDLEPGEYTVQWRVVSSDGHPIDGENSFTIKGANGANGAASDTETSPAGDGVGLGAGAVDEPSAAGQGGEKGSLSEADAENTSSGPALAEWLLIGVGAIAAVVIVVVLVTRKGKGAAGAGSANDGSDK